MKVIIMLMVAKLWEASCVDETIETCVNIILSMLLLLGMLLLLILDEDDDDNDYDDIGDDDDNDDVQSSKLGEDHQWVPDLSPCARLSSTFTRL